MRCGLAQALTAQQHGSGGGGGLLPPDGAENAWLQDALACPQPRPRPARPARSAFVDIQRYWQGQDDMPDEMDQFPDEEITIERPKMGSGIEWLGIVEDSKYLQNTDLGSADFIGTPEKSANGKIWDANGTPVKLKPGEFPKCEEFLTYPDVGAPWWHPSFAFKVPVHAVNIKLTSLYPKKKKLWDVIFAGGQGGPNRVTHPATPAGGDMPQFPPFCPPLNGKAKFELEITEAQNGSWTEKLTLMPQAAAGAARLKWLMANSMKPRFDNHTNNDVADGSLEIPPPPTLPGDSDSYNRPGPGGEINYMSMPPLAVTGALAGLGFL